MSVIRPQLREPCRRQYELDPFHPNFEGEYPGSFPTIIWRELFVCWIFRFPSDLT
ncbi:hypothetical protein TNCV_910001, partial [Trichonephila clavipes]